VVAACQIGCVRTSSQTTAQRYFLFYFLHRLSGLGCLLLLSVTITESSEKFCHREFIIEERVFFCDTHIYFMKLAFKQSLAD
jgi:hypothetical protein